jgi:hypothetical protein
MNPVLNQHSVLYIILTEWAPIFITIIGGGLTASVLVPRWQNKYNRNKALETRRLEIAEHVAKALNRYVYLWGRVISISKLEHRNVGLTPDQKSRKDSFIDERNNGRLELSDALCSAELYFGNYTELAINRFRKWDEGFSSASLADLPSIEEFNEEKTVLIGALKKEVRS